jgi:hypothetical protein
MPPVLAEGKGIFCTIQVAQLRQAACFIFIVCLLIVITMDEINN